MRSGRFLIGMEAETLFDLIHRTGEPVSVDGMGLPPEYWYVDVGRLVWKRARFLRKHKPEVFSREDRLISDLIWVVDRCVLHELLHTCDVRHPEGSDGRSLDYLEADAFSFDNIAEEMMGWTKKANPLSARSGLP
ncbi:MAG: hypothetical protein ABSG92_11200 [Conexivisphaerales archaeon]